MTNRNYIENSACPAYRALVEIVMTIEVFPGERGDALIDHVLALAKDGIERDH